MSKITKKERIKELERQVKGLTVLFSSLNTWSEYADSMLTELNHALPDPEYDAKCEAQEADVDASLDGHRERLGLNKPQLKQLDQSIFNGLDEKWRFAAVDLSGEAWVYRERPKIDKGDDRWSPSNTPPNSIGICYDTSNWQNSLIERDIAKELLEVDLSSELTGSDYYYSKSVTERLEKGQKSVMCFVSNVSEADAMDDRYIQVITSVDTEFNDRGGYGWQYAVAINNQGEPLTASEVGL